MPGRHNPIFQLALATLVWGATACKPPEPQLDTEQSVAEGNLALGRMRSIDERLSEWGVELLKPEQTKSILPVFNKSESNQLKKHLTDYIRDGERLSEILSRNDVSVQDAARLRQSLAAARMLRSAVDLQIRNSLESTLQLADIPTIETEKLPVRFRTAWSYCLNLMLDRDQTMGIPTLFYNRRAYRKSLTALTKAQRNQLRERLTDRYDCFVVATVGLSTSIYREWAADRLPGIRELSVDLRELNEKPDDSAPESRRDSH